MASTKSYKGELRGGKPRLLEELKWRIQDNFIVLPGNALENILVLAFQVVI
jgi:hypothetical protein